MEDGITDALGDFVRFGYAATSVEIYRCHPDETTQKLINAQLDAMVKNGRLRLIEMHNDQPRYTLPEYRISSLEMHKRHVRAEQLLSSVTSFVKILSLFPQFELIGISGSVAAHNADSEADIDIFVVSARRRMWSARLISIAVAALMGRRRPRLATSAPGSICLNMYMDESDLVIPPQKRSKYVAHELLQMRPVWYSHDAYTRLLRQNTWILGYFPNGYDTHEGISHSPFLISHVSRLILGVIDRVCGDLVDKLLGRLQMSLINRHRTIEFITPTQLWFFPHDHGSKE